MNLSASRMTRAYGVEPAQHNRLCFLDNMRTFVVFLVILCHAGIVYESSGIGAYFWIVDDPSTNDLSGIVNVVLDIFMMPVLFFLSGYLALGSLQRQGSWHFLRRKAYRLLLPWLLAVFTLIPAYKVIFLYSRGLPQEHWTTYLYWNNGIISQNWLWFLPILFLFNALFLLLTRLPIKPLHLSLKTALPGAMIIGFLYTYCIDVGNLRGWTKIGILDFQNERLLVYFLTFLIGTLCYQKRLFAQPPQRKWLYIAANTVAWIPINAYVVFLLYPWINPGSFLVSASADRLILWASFHISLLMLVYLTIETFRRYQTKAGYWRQLANHNSYSVYIVHTVVLGIIALGLQQLALPSLVKYATLATGTYVVSHLIVWLWQQSTRVLGQPAVRQTRNNSATMIQVDTLDESMLKLN
jgi:hypothetical protein